MVEFGNYLFIFFMHISGKKVLKFTLCPKSLSLLVFILLNSISFSQNLSEFFQLVYF